MTTLRANLRVLFAALALVACGGGSGETRTTETTPDTTETSPPAPAATSDAADETPPPPAATAPRVRVIHATNDEAAASISVGIDSDAEPFVASLAYGRASGYVAVAEGRHSVMVYGAESDTGRTTLGLASDVLESDHAYTVFFVTQGAADAPFALYTGDDDDDPGDEVAAIRFFHAIQGVDDVDLCTPGATARAAGTPLFADVARNALGSAANLRYVDLEPAAEVALQVRAHSSDVCHGRLIGVSRFTPTAGISYTAVAIGNPSGRPRAAAQLLICRDAPSGDGGCDTVALAAH
jgi:hypothetical protein